MFSYVKVTGNRLSGITMYNFGKHLWMNQIFKTFRHKNF